MIIHNFCCCFSRTLVLLVIPIHLIWTASGTTLSPFNNNFQIHFSLSVASDEHHTYKPITLNPLAKSSSFLITSWMLRKNNIQYTLSVQCSFIAFLYRPVAQRYPGTLLPHRRFIIMLFNSILVTPSDYRSYRFWLLLPFGCAPHTNRDTEPVE